MQRMPSGQAMIWAKLDMMHYNLWKADFDSRKKTNTEKSNRREALALTGNIMKTCKVRSGRYRMGWGGAYKMMSMRPPPKSGKAGRYSSVLRKGKRISASKAQKEGTKLASAEEERDGSKHMIKIVNAVVYGPVEEARRGNVRKAIKFRTKYFMKQSAKAIAKAGEDSQR